MKVFQLTRLESEEMLKGMIKKTENDRLEKIREEQKRLKKEIARASKADELEQVPRRISAVDEQRAKYLAKKRKTRRPDEDKVTVEPFRSFEILAKLDLFRQTLKDTKDEDHSDEQLHEEEGDLDLDNNEEDAKDQNWKRHKLRFRPEKKVRDPNREEKYITHDPLLLSKVKPMSQHQRRLQGRTNFDKW